MSADRWLIEANQHQLTLYSRTYVWPDEEADEPEYTDRPDDTHNCQPDPWDQEDGATAVSLAADFLQREGLTQPSSSPGPWTQFTWLSYGEDPVTNYATGEREERSAHFKNFTDAGADAVVAIVTGIACPYTPEPPEED